MSWCLYLPLSSLSLSLSLYICKNCMICSPRNFYLFVCFCTYYIYFVFAFVIGCICVAMLRSFLVSDLAINPDLAHCLKRKPPFLTFIQNQSHKLTPNSENLSSREAIQMIYFMWLMFDFLGLTRHFFNSGELMYTNNTSEKNPSKPSKPLLMNVMNFGLGQRPNFGEAWNRAEKRGRQ